MAAAAPGQADARVPCPLCGGLIHPIAGRCKHCKGDLSALRASRPAAAAALPALQAPAAPPPPVAPNPYAIANGHGNGHSPAHHAQHAYQAHAQVPLPVQVAHAAAAFPQHDISQAILPPRPTGRMPAAPARASWKSWPVIVIILAVIAIVTAIVLMVWPPGGATDHAGPTSVQPVPAPERMDTSPLPPSTPPSSKAPAADPNDPWSNRSAPPPGRQPAPDIDDPNLQDPLARDPFSRRGGGTLGTTGTFMTAMMAHACERLTQCGTIDPTFKAVCDVYARRLPRAAPPASCPAAQRCLAHIDSMDCDTDVADAATINRVLTQFSDCTEALSC